MHKLYVEQSCTNAEACHRKKVTAEHESICQIIHCTETKTAGAQSHLGGQKQATIGPIHAWM